MKLVLEGLTKYFRSARIRVQKHVLIILAHLDHAQIIVLRVVIANLATLKMQIIFVLSLKIVQVNFDEREPKIIAWNDYAWQ